MIHGDNGRRQLSLFVCLLSRGANIKVWKEWKANGVELTPPGEELGSAVDRVQEELIVA